MVYNFVIDYSDADIADFTKIDSLAGVVQENTPLGARIFAKGDLSWCLQTYINLSKSTDLAVKCSNRLADDCINIIHSDSLLNLKGKNTHFIVCVQADHARRNWSHYHIVQNKNQVLANTSYIPHWLQPGIIKRNLARNGVKRVAYAGQTYNKNLAGSEDDWQKLLEPHGIEFVALANDSWHDLSEVDLLIGIRSFDANPHNRKPPSKLFNAWHAEIPFIGGNDSAYQQVGTPGVDYLAATTLPAAIDAILQLQKDPALYQKLVQNGREKACLYNETSITKIWVDVLTGPVIERYQQWKANPFVEQTRFKTLLNVSNLEYDLKQFVKKMLGAKKHQALVNLYGFMYLGLLT